MPLHNKVNVHTWRESNARYGASAKPSASLLRGAVDEMGSMCHHQHAESTSALIVPVTTVAVCMIDGRLQPKSSEAQAKNGITTPGLGVGQRPTALL